MNLAVPIIVARALVREGFAVFPVFDKRPLTPHGVHSAARNLSEFGKLNWRDANGVGIATGKASGIDVLDADIRQPIEDQRKIPHVCEGRDGLATLASLPPLPETRAASTPSGGRHYWFRHIEGSRNRTNLAPGLEWFSDGKLVVVPPAPGREWINETEIAEAPEWLRMMVLGGPTRNEAGPGTTGTREISSGLLMTGANSSNQLPKPIYSLIIRLMPHAYHRQQRWAGSLWKLVADKPLAVMPHLTMPLGTSEG
jgi:Bifunctional DNA primase/polymerase, N-terminal